MVHRLALAEGIVRRQVEQVIGRELVNLFPHFCVWHVRLFRGGPRLTVVEVPAVVFAPTDQVRS
ncbi:hypothetical protein D3C83_269330 [compost metagenome]